MLTPILAKVQKDFKASAAEIGYHEKWTESVIACVYLSNSTNHTQTVLSKISQMIEERFLYVNIIDTHCEYL